jgi:hypothetical protein
VLGRDAGHVWRLAFMVTPPSSSPRRSKPWRS